MSFRSALAALLTLALSTPALAKRKAQPPPPSTMAQVSETKLPLETQDPQRKVAEQYLDALTGKGSDAGRDHLLGGATMTARIFQLENWKIVSREPHKREVGELSDVNALVDALDREGRAALGKIMGGGPAGDDMTTHEFSAEDAHQILAPTRAKAALFTKTHPVFAYVARVDKEVYWHPKNPFRPMLQQAGASGKYTLDFDLFWVETDEGLSAEKTARKWPLRVVRFVSDKIDTGYKILPASDWNAE